MTAPDYIDPLDQQPDEDYMDWEDRVAQSLGDQKCDERRCEGEAL